MTLRPLALTLLALLLPGPVASAQPTDAMMVSSEAEAKVMTPILRLFDGMRAADTSMVASAFHPLATLYSVGPNNEGEVVVRVTPTEQFIAFLAEPHNEVYDERLGDAEVRIDGDLATVWVPYAFYVGNRFSHCGIDAFQLAFIKDEWLIIHTSDTRRRENCDPSLD